MDDQEREEQERRNQQLQDDERIKQQGGIRSYTPNADKATSEDREYRGAQSNA